MNQGKFSLVPEMEGLLATFTELLTGEADEKRMEMVAIWCLYSHMGKVMPQMVQHWASEPRHQEARARIRQIIEQIKQWNQEKAKGSAPSQQPPAQT